MYESFYGMRERPFAGQAGFTVVTGEIGSGKTTLIREFLKRADRTTNLGVISNTHIAFGDLLQWVLLAFGMPSEGGDKATRYQTFLRYLIEQYGAGKRTVLIVDEAQNLSIESLEELRLLSNVNADKDQLLQMILVGQPELLENLKRPELRQFAQRISVHYHLSPLTGTETRAYIRHRLAVAGADPGLFDREAVSAISYFSGGVPRLINSICDMALVYGFAAGRHAISIDTILAVVRDKERSSLLILPRSSRDISREALIAEIDRAFGEEKDGAGEEAAASSPAVPVESLPKAAEPPPTPARPRQGSEARAVSGSPVRPARPDGRVELGRDPKVMMPIMPSYLEGDGKVGAKTASAKRGGRSRWWLWLL